MKKKYLMLLAVMLLATGCSKTEKQQDPNSVQKVIESSNATEQVIEYNENDESTYAYVDDGTSSTFTVEDKVNIQTTGSNNKNLGTKSETKTEENQELEDTLLADAKSNINKISLPINHMWTYSDLANDITLKEYSLSSKEKYVELRNSYGTLEYATKPTNTHVVGLSVVYSDSSIKSVNGICNISDFSLIDYTPVVASIESIEKKGTDYSITCAVYFGQNRHNCVLRVGSDWIIKEFEFVDGTNATAEVTTVLAVKKTSSDFNQTTIKPQDAKDAVEVWKGNTVVKQEEPAEQPTQQTPVTEQVPSTQQTTTVDGHGQSKIDKKTDFEFDEAGGVKYINITVKTIYEDGCYSVTVTKKDPQGNIVGTDTDISHMLDHSNDIPSVQNTQQQLTNTQDYFTVKDDAVFVTLQLDENVIYDDVKQVMLQVYTGQATPSEPYVGVDGLTGYFTENNNTRMIIAYYGSDIDTVKAKLIEVITKTGATPVIE